MFNCFKWPFEEEIPNSEPVQEPVPEPEPEPVFA
jgi:hypothetical protein